MRFLCIAVAVSALSAMADAQVAVADNAATATVSADSIKTVVLPDLSVLGTRAQKQSPMTFSLVSRSELEAHNQALDLPFLLLSTPGVVVTSDAGAGVGYTSLRVRGSDPSRVNITLNDIPMNDAESHTIYWVNTPDLVANVQDIQIQRGVGTSTNGAGAFGASVNMRTIPFARDPYAHVSGTYGSYKTRKATVQVGTGLLGNRFAFDGRVSRIASDGYRDRASSSLYSYYVQGGYFGNATSVRLITFGGKETTYHAWDGISRKQLDSDRTYNPNGEIKRDGKVVGFYPDQNDIYRQFHYQLIANHCFNPSLGMNLALHYTNGSGYYQEYKNNRTLREYLLQPVVIDGVPRAKASLVRRKHVSSDFGGLVFSLNYAHRRLNATLGGAINRYVNNHYGQVVWVENYTANLDVPHNYYRNNGRKTDVNVYLKGDYTIWRGLSAYADLQLRHIKFSITGDNDKWDWTASPEHLQTLNVHEPFTFFNPKAGLNWQINADHRVYASVAVAHKEPTRNNYNDGPLIEHPRAERLVDWEAGYAYNHGPFSAAVNLYRMNYKDQLVLNGKLNEIGEMMAENVPHSYRMGAELTAAWQIIPALRIDLNAAFSRNRINDYIGYLSDYNADTWDEMYTQTAIYRRHTTIAFSPTVTSGGRITFAMRGFEAQLQTLYVSRQYLDNFESRDDSLDPYCVSNLHLSYTFGVPKIGCKAINIAVGIYNLFNHKYENNGYSQTAALYPNGDKSATMTLSHDPRFYPMAGTNVLGTLTLKF